METRGLHSIQCKTSRRPLDHCQYVLTLTLTDDLLTQKKHTICIVCANIIACTKFEDFGIIADKQTGRWQTESQTHADE